MCCFRGLNQRAFIISIENVCPRAVLEAGILNRQVFIIPVGSVVLEAAILNERAFIILAGSVGL